MDNSSDTFANREGSTSLKRRRVKPHFSSGRADASKRLGHGKNKTGNDCRGLARESQRALARAPDAPTYIFVGSPSHSCRRLASCAPPGHYEVRLCMLLDESAIVANDGSREHCRQSAMIKTNGKQHRLRRGRGGWPVMMPRLPVSWQDMTIDSHDPLLCASSSRLDDDEFEAHDGKKT